MIAGREHDQLLPVPGRLIVPGVMGFCHLVALLALLPYFFSWTGVVVAIVSVLTSLLGINVGYHRLLTHKGLSCPKPVEHTLAILGVLSNQFGPAYWVALHRRHHQFADDRRDPHSPSESLLWAHMGWLYRATENSAPEAVMERYAKDLLKDPFYVWLERNGHWGQISLAQWPAFFVLGALVALATGGGGDEALRLGSSVVVWGVALRLTVVWHVTFSVNSICHRWGYRNHATPDESRNNPIVGILACGEGWHNNHHAFPRSARHGHRWWEFDLSWLIIKGMAAVGLVKVLHAWSPDSPSSPPHA